MSFADTEKFPLCHLRAAPHREPFLERLARAGCRGVLVEVQLACDNAADVRAIQRHCDQLDLAFWLMPVMAASSKMQAWMLDINKSPPRPLPREGVFNILQENAADGLFDQLQRYYESPPAGVFVATPFAPAHEPFPWTADFEKYFYKQHGYHFQEKWHCLTATIGADDAMVRQHYWETINARVQVFLARCDERAQQAKSTFRHNVMEPELAAFSLPDTLLQRRRAAHSVEIIPFEDWPQLLNATFACRINDARHLAVELPEDFEEEPARRYFTIAHHVAELPENSENAAQVGMLFPLRSARTHYHPDSHRYPRWVGEDMQRVQDYLDTMHYDYRLVEETELQNPPCELLVIPSATALAAESWEHIEAWIGRGGKVACAGLLPRWSERGRDAELEDRVSRATKQTVQDIYDGYLAWERGTAMPPHIGYPIFSEDISGGRLCSYTPRLNHDAEDARLRMSQIWRESLHSDFSSQNPHVLYRHFTAPEAEHFYLYNNSDQPQELKARWIPARPDAVRQINTIDLNDGAVSPCLVWEAFPALEGGGISLPLSLAARELRAYELRFEAETPHLERANFVVEAIEGESIRGYARENILPFCVMEQSGKSMRWTAPKVLLPAPQFIDEDEWQEDKSTFTAEIFVPAEWENHRVILEMRPARTAVQVHCNGQKCGLQLAPPFLFDLSAAVRLDEMNQVNVQLWQNGADEPGPARLVAWPEIDINK